MRDRMKRSSLGMVVALAVTLLPAVVHAQPKVSGTIVAVASDGQSFALEELGVEGKPVRRTVALGAGAGLLEVSREPADRVVAGEWPGGFHARPLDARDLKVGDFVTVILDRAGDELTAIANRIERVRTDSGDAAPSPRIRPEPPSRPAR